jgi:hypothetical protein
MKLLSRKTEEQPRNDSEQRSGLEMDMRIRALERIVKQLDYDLQDAVDGFYRRRQADRMREIRKEDEVKKEPRRRMTDSEMIRAAMRLSDSSETKSDGTE